MGFASLNPSYGSERSVGTLRFAHPTLATLAVLEIGGTRVHSRIMTQVTCTCGAVFEVIDTKGPSRNRDDSVKCTECGKEMFCWAGSNVGQLRLVSRPEADRE